MHFLFLCVRVYQRPDAELFDVSADRRASSYAGGTARRNTRSSLNAVGAGRSSLNARSQLDRHRYLAGPGGGGSAHRKQVLANSTAADPPPLHPPDAALLVLESAAADAGDDRPSTLGRPSSPSASHQRPVTVAVLSEHRPPSPGPAVDRRQHTPRPGSPPPPSYAAAATDDDYDKPVASSARATVDTLVGRNNHHIYDSSAPSQQQQQQQEQHHIV